MQQIIPGIFETDVGGHKAIYIKLLVEALNEIGFQPVLFMPDGLKQSEPFRHYLSPMEDRFHHIPIPSLISRNTYWQEQERFNLLNQVFGKKLVNHLFVPYGDGLVQRMGLASKKAFLKRMGACRVESLVFRCRFAYPQRSLLAGIRARLLLWSMVRAPIAKLHVLDRMGFEVLCREVPRLRCGFSHIPELLDPWDNGSSRKSSGDEDHVSSSRVVLDKSRLIGLLGATTHRKGYDLLLRAFVETSQRHEAVLLIAGPHCVELREQLKNTYAELVERGRIVSVDRFLSEDEFREWFHRIDMVCLPYRDHQGVSSIYLRAAVLGKPTLVSDKGWFTWAVPNYSHGEMVDVCSPEAFRDSLWRFIKKPHREHRITTQGEQILDQNSPAAVKAAWTELLRQRIQGLS